jgi:chemotaxis response regulator CheB
MPNGPIRVLLVDDSPFALAVLKRVVSSSPDLEVVGTAKNGKEALAIIPSLNPAVICTDLEMPSWMDSNLRGGHGGVPPSDPGRQFARPE